jgi:hypothetical protein
MGHLLSCKDCPQKCTLEDLWPANKKGFDVAQYWAKTLEFKGPDTIKKEKESCDNLKHSNIVVTFYTELGVT